MSARDELAKLLFQQNVSNAAAPTAPEIIMLCEDAADAILEAGYSKPRTITDHYADDGPDELPALSVILSAGRPAIKQGDGTFMDYDGSTWDTRELDLPITVIYSPEES